MAVKFIILGSGSSMGMPRADGYTGNCNLSNKKNLRTRCSALIKFNEPVKQCIKIFNFSDLYDFRISYVSSSAFLECMIIGILSSIEASIWALKLSICLSLLL